MHLSADILCEKCVFLSPSSTLDFKQDTVYGGGGLRGSFELYSK